jgi:benzoyl-CoA reductase/2-hydroxyglutaryl-CoA dehydratase subunit BcrC/BadD/HgdB
METRCSSIALFEEAAQQIEKGLWPREIVESGQPIVAVLCNLTPLEIVHAAGAVPVRLCAGATIEPRDNERSSEFKTQNSRLKIIEPPRDLCQVVKGAAVRLEALQRQTGRPPLAVVVPATCDWKAQCCGFFGLGEETRVLDVPRDRSSPRARRQWRKQIAELADFLGERTGTPVRRASLLRSVTLYQQATRLGRQLADLMKRPVPPIAGSDLMLAFNMFYSLPVESWIAAASSLLEELWRRLTSDFGELSRVVESSACEKAPSPAGEDDRLPICPTRLLLVGAPIIWPNWWLPRLVESLGGAIVADALCSSLRGFSDLVSVDETTRPALIEALADRYLLPCTCPCFTPNEEYLWRIENQISDYRIEGAIIHRLRNCYLFDIEAMRLEELFRKCGIPSLQVESDYESPASGALTTRVEAFLELVREQRAIR